MPVLAGRDTCGRLASNARLRLTGNAVRNDDVVPTLRCQGMASKEVRKTVTLEGDRHRERGRECVSVMHDRCSTNSCLISVTEHCSRCYSTVPHAPAAREMFTLIVGFELLSPTAVPLPLWSKQERWFWRWWRWRWWWIYSLQYHTSIHPHCGSSVLN